MDWGVSGEGEDDIYQTPVLDSVPSSGMKRSDTAGDLTSDSKKSELNYQQTCHGYTHFSLL